MKRLLLPFVALILGGLIVLAIGQLGEDRTDWEAVRALPWVSVIDTQSGAGAEFEGVRIDHIERRAPFVTRAAGGCAVADFADVRLVVPGWRDHVPQEILGLLISTTLAPTEQRGTGKRAVGTGRDRVAVQERRGITEIRWGELELSVSEAILRVDGREVPLGTGRRLLIFDEEGRLTEIRPG